MAAAAQPVAPDSAEVCQAERSARLEERSGVAGLGGGGTSKEQRQWSLLCSAMADGRGGKTGARLVPARKGHRGRAQ